MFGSSTWMHAARLNTQSCTEVDADRQKEMRKQTENYMEKDHGEGNRRNGTDVGAGKSNCEG